MRLIIVLLLSFVVLKVGAQEVNAVLGSRVLSPEEIAVEKTSENTVAMEEKVVSKAFKGTFKSNVERIAKQWGFSPVIWDARVERCIWQQDTEYEIPKSNGRDVLTYYASTQDFITKFSEVDNHVEIIYRGPLERLNHCK